MAADTPDTRQTTLDELRPYCPSLQDLQRTEAIRHWAIEFVEKQFRATSTFGDFEVISTKDPTIKYLFHHWGNTDEVQCRCPGFKYRGDCRHASAYRISKGLVKIIELRETPWKAGQVILLDWLDRLDIDEDNPRSSRDILNLILNDGTMMKVQSLRSRLTELERYLFVPLVKHAGKKKPWFYYITDEGRKYIEEYHRGKIDPIGSL